MTENQSEQSYGGKLQESRNNSPVLCVNVAMLFHRANLCRRRKRGMRGHRCPASELGRRGSYSDESMSEQKRESWQDGTGV